VLDSPEMRATGVTVQMQAHWAHVNMHAGFSREACWIISKYVPKLPVL
jgi:hypothetical protein